MLYNFNEKLSLFNEIILVVVKQNTSDRDANYIVVIVLQILLVSILELTSQ